MAKNHFLKLTPIPQTPAPPVSKPAPPKKFDYLPLLKKFDVAEITKSPIKYFDAVLSVTDELLNILQEYEEAQAETIAESLKMTLKLNAKYTDNPNLTSEENSLLAERQKFLAQRLELGTDAPKKKILSVKAQAEKFSERLEKINDSENYQKFAFTAGGDLQEKFETESELYKLAEKFQRALQEIIFSRDKTEERVFLLRWAEPLLNLPIDEISDFIRDKNLDSIAEEVLTSFAELRRQNFEKYLADSKTYGEAAQKREKEFNALIFRMRKDLHKS